MSQIPDELSTDFQAGHSVLLVSSLLKLILTVLNHLHLFPNAWPKYFGGYRELLLMWPSHLFRGTGERPFISEELENKGQILRGTETTLGNRKNNFSIFGNWETSQFISRDPPPHPPSPGGPQ